MMMGFWWEQCLPCPAQLWWRAFWGRGKEVLSFFGGVISLPFPLFPVGNWGSSWSEGCLSMLRLWPWVPLLVSLWGNCAGASRCCNAAGQRGCWAPGWRDLHKARNVLNHNVLNAHSFLGIFLQTEKWWKLQMCVCEYKGGTRTYFCVRAGETTQLAAACC